MLMDMEFDKLDEILGNIKFNIAAAREHMVEVNTIIRTVTDHGRGIVNTLPYSYLPSHINIHHILELLCS